jgi:acyl carrier protein
MNVRKLFEDAVLLNVYTPPKNYTLDTPLKELGDSLDLTVVLNHIAEVADKDLGKVDFNTLRTVGDVIAFLEQKINPRPNLQPSEKPSSNSPESGSTSEL